MERDDAPIDAAGYAAGELDPAAAAAFARRLAAEPALQREVAWWRGLRDGLEPVADLVPPPGLAAAIVRRAEIAQPPARPHLRLLPIAAWIGIAAALLIGIGIGWSGAVAHGHRAEPVAWLEDGSAVLMPRDGLTRRVGFLPQADAHGATWQRPQPTDRNDNPWLGVWIKPVEIAAPEVGSPTGHLVVMVAEHGPAGAAGVVPGDLLVLVAGCPLATPLCITHAIADKRPGETVTIVWWQATTGQRRSAEVVLGSLID